MKHSSACKIKDLSRVIFLLGGKNTELLHLCTFCIKRVKLCFIEPSKSDTLLRAATKLFLPNDSRRAAPNYYTGKKTTVTLLLD